jgi:hypothetical protein
LQTFGSVLVLMAYVASLVLPIAGAAGCEVAAGGLFLLMSGSDPIGVVVSPTFLTRSCVFDVLPVGSSGSRASKWIRE